MLRRCLFSAALLVIGSLVLADDVTVAWDPNPLEESVTGYLIYYGRTSRGAAGFVGYEREIDVGNVTLYLLSLPDEGSTYYMAAKAYNVAGLRSEYSNEISRAPRMEAAENVIVTVRSAN